MDKKEKSEKGRDARFGRFTRVHTKSAHTPVLLKEVIEILNPQPGEFFIDGTIGSGGHAKEILKRILPDGRLLGIDWDKESLRVAQQKISSEFEKDSRKSFAIDSRAILTHGNYADLPEILKKIRKADPSIPLRASGLLLDLGMSSEQLGEAGRGFSFLRDEPLDMRYSAAGETKNQKLKTKNLTAAEVVNNFNEKDLAEIFWKYGEERYSRQIAKKIIALRHAQGSKRPIKTTFDLVEVIKKSVPRNYERGRINPATRVFQALRIYVNQELENLETLLKNLDKIIKVKGRVAIISFHSLEDRLVKNYFRELKNQGKARILTKKPIRPTPEEVAKNPRSRSAKLRACSIISS